MSFDAEAVRSRLVQNSVNANYRPFFVVGLVLAVAGGALFAISAMTVGAHQRAWHAFHVNWLFWTGLTCGSIAITSVHKLVGAKWIVWELLRQDLAANMHQWVYVGDSTNDQQMFEAFPYSVGVANIRRFENELTHLPEYIAQRERGAGFAEISAALISTISSSTSTSFTWPVVSNCPFLRIATWVHTFSTSSSR